MTGYKREKKKRRRSFFGRAATVLLISICILGGLWLTGKLDLSFLTNNDEWYLTIVNKSNSVPGNWKIDFTELKNGEKIDSRIYPYLQAMFDDCRAAGLLPVVKSSYRSAEDQQAALDEKTEAFIAEGYSADKARELAKTVAAQPGYSEHQLGLAVDIDSEDTSVCSNEAVWEWMRAHCDDYGFILRYPSGKETVTGFSYEPWHFRYVGKAAAKTIMDGGITLEEYLNEGKK